MKMKKLFAGLVATSMVAAMGTSAMAATYNDENGTVAIGADLAGYAGQQVTVLIVEADANGVAPTNIDDTMILYIDQTEAAAGIFQDMGVKGGALEAGKTYVVRIGGEDLDEGIIEEVLTIEADTPDVPPAPTYTLGDVNMDTSIDMGDAAAILNHFTGDSIITDETAKLAADVNVDTSIDMGDAAAILNHFTGDALIVQPQ